MGWETYIIRTRNPMESHLDGRTLKEIAEMDEHKVRWFDVCIAKERNSLRKMYLELGRDYCIKYHGVTQNGNLFSEGAA